MKLNKSIFGLVILAIFVLSSCSQARYGNRTRRVKANPVVQTSKKVDRLKTAKGLIQGEKVEDTDNDEVAVVEKVETRAETVQSTFMLEKDPSTRFQKIAVKRVKSKVVEKALEKLEDSKVLAKVQQAKENIDTSITQTDDEVGDILYIVLVVILVLLILSLISNLFPILNWILGVALLVFLIYLLLQIL